jgi:uncharacterized membrane protein
LREENKMNRVEFMRQLESLLWNLSESDRLDAIAYYNDYFDEAGVENEERVLKELGSPERVAAMIKADLNTDGNEQAEYTEQGYSDGRQGVNPNTPATRKQKKVLPIALIIVLLVFAAPVLLGVGGGLLGGILGLAGGLIGLVAGGIGMLAGGVVSLVSGVIKLVFSPLKGLVLIGTGSLITALGLLIVVFFLVCQILF